MNAASDILIIGGGIIGLSLALELRLRGASVTVLSRENKQAAAFAAAGMLAPQAEGIPPGAMRDLCLYSRSLYPDWTRKLEEITGIDVGYWPCGILAPVFEKTEVGEEWLEKPTLNLLQPGLSPEIAGAHWFPEDAQVDNRALMQALRVAVQDLGVNLRDGVAVQAIQQRQGKVTSLQTTAGDWQAEHYVLATGAWAKDLLLIPVYPIKGQMAAVQMSGWQEELPLPRVLFGDRTYLVPRRDGRLIIGATSENVGFTSQNTPLGVRDLLERAIRLFPAVQNWPIQEFWWGFRPATPDELPILGTSPCDNLTLATGHYRNGILLAPATATLLADLIWQQKTHPLLDSFHYARFFPTAPTNQENGQKMSDRPNATLVWQTPSEIQPPPASDLLTIAGKTFHSRLMTGTGKYRDMAAMRQSIAASGCQIVTVAVRRMQANAPGHEGLAEALDWTKLWMLPNTAGCQTADEVIRVARLGREMAKLLGQEDNNFVKLEAIPDAKYLLPDPIETLIAAEQLVKEGFAVLPYINADPVLAKRLENVGCATVMPLGSPIGSGQGIKNTANIQIIIENAGIPVVVDAGIGAPSEAAQAMELGAAAVLINTAIAQAENPVAMGRAMGLAVEAGRLAYHAGRIPIKAYASASSPTLGVINSANPN